MSGQALSQTAKGVLYLLAGAATISFAPLFVHFTDVGPTPVAFYRCLFGGCALALLAVIRRERLVPDKGVFLMMLLAALFFAGDLACWHQSILYLGPGLATIVTNFQAFFLAIIGVIFLKERMSLRLALAIPLAFFGLWLLLGVDIADMPRDMGMGLFLGLCTAAFYTGYILTLRRSQSLGTRLPAIANMAVISLMAAVFSWVLSILQGQSLDIGTAGDGALLVLYGVGCQGLGWYLLSSGLPLLPASRGGLLLLAQPALAFIWDVLLVGRPTSYSGYLGAALALFAIGFGMVERPTRIKKT
ncbi:DMT family transporter [Desulfovibrio sp. OttesenSCG-928-G11]|nr:DMT family transporter [Desulfovibrio sp. OttesenSCG-928-G11]